MAIIMIISMILMLLVWIVSTIFGATCCKRCNGAYKPRKFSNRDLLINKGVMVGFCAMTAIGCFIVFAETGPLYDGTKDLTAGLTSTVSDLDQNVTDINTAFTNALTDPGLKAVSDIAKVTQELEEASGTVDKTAKDAKKDVDDAIDLGGGYTLIAAGVMFGVSFLVMAAGVIGWYRILILFVVILSLFLILGWIVWGALSITNVLIDDLCYAMKEYLNDKYASDLNDLIPCLDPKVAVEVMNKGREMVATGIASVNNKLEDFAGSNPYLKFICYNYVKMDMEKLCTEPTPFYTQRYSQFVCEARQNGKLATLKKVDGVQYAYPKAFCPYPTSFYSVAVGDFGKPAPKGLRELRCPFKLYDTEADKESEKVNEFSAAQCYALRQIPYDVFDEGATTATVAQTLLDVIPKIGAVLYCDVVSTAFNRMVGPCDDMTDALTSLWAGFLLVSIGYFCIWVSAIVIISRLKYKEEYCTDGDAYKV